MRPLSVTNRGYNQLSAATLPIIETFFRSSTAAWGGGVIQYIVTRNAFFLSLFMLVACTRTSEDMFTTTQYLHRYIYLHSTH